MCIYTGVYTAPFTYVHTCFTGWHEKNETPKKRKKNIKISNKKTEIKMVNGGVHTSAKA